MIYILADQQQRCHAEQAISILQSPKTKYCQALNKMKAKRHEI